MQFLVKGLDWKDSEAMNRRLAVRENHIALWDKLLESGNMWYWAALIDDEWKMKWSTFIMDFPSEKELQDWLDIEPYVTWWVWKEIEIHKASVREPWQFSRPQSFFE